MIKPIVLVLLIAGVICGQECKLVKSEESSNVMLVGTSTREVFQDSNFAQWFNSEYKSYRVDSETLSQNETQFEGKLIKIVLGTWCSDSRREVPRMLKILDSVDYLMDKLLLIGVDRDKKGLHSEVDGLNIDFVPTFIVYESEKEIGRIIESPEVSLEKDLVKIISHK